MHEMRNGRRGGEGSMDFVAVGGRDGLSSGPSLSHALCTSAVNLCVYIKADIFGG
jgi:hypothetical protein